MMLKRLKVLVKKMVPDALLFYKGSSDSGCVSLTYDDGPFPGNTEKILSVLKKHNIKATFFVNGAPIVENGELYDRIVEDGHEVGNHLYRHNPVTSLSYKELRREIKDCQDLIDRPFKGVVKSRLFRPPMGAVDLKTMWFILHNRRTIVLWSIDSLDLERSSLEDSIEVFREKGLSPGDIVLLHDDSKYAEALLEWIIKEANRKGLRFVTVTELLHYCEN